MPNIREDISQIKDLFKEINADSRLTNKQVFSLLEKHTAMFIYRESNKLNILNNSTLFQEIKCIPVIQAPAFECADIDLNCTIYRTKYKLPSIFEDGAGPIIASVSSIDDWTQIDLIPLSEFKRRINNPWASKNKSKKILAYYKDGYIYFPDKKLDLINVRGFFKEKIETEEYCNPCKDCKKPCKKFLDNPSLIPTHLRAAVIQAVIQDLANTYAKIPSQVEEINKNTIGPK